MSCVYLCHIKYNVFMFLLSEIRIHWNPYLNRDSHGINLKPMISMKIEMDMPHRNRVSKSSEEFSIDTSGGLAHANRDSHTTSGEARPILSLAHQRLEKPDRTV